MVLIGPQSAVGRVRFSFSDGLLPSCLLLNHSLREFVEIFAVQVTFYKRIQWASYGFSASRRLATHARLPRPLEESLPRLPKGCDNLRCLHGCGICLSCTCNYKLWNRLIYSVAYSTYPIFSRSRRPTRPPKLVRTNNLKSTRGSRVGTISWKF